MTVTTNPVPSRVLPAGCSFAGANPPGVRTRSFGWQARWAAIGAAIAVVAGTGGVAFSGATNAQITPSQTLITPCRIMDTRSGPNNVGPRNTPLNGGETYSIQVTGTNGNCTIPSGTSGVVMNVTIVGPGSNGFLTVFPGGANKPTASNLNYVTGQAPTPNQVTVALGSTGQVSFFASGGPVNVIADIAGYTTAARLTNPQLAQNRWDQDLAKPATVAVGLSFPAGVLYDGTNIWVANAAANTVLRVDPTTNAAVGSAIPVGTSPSGLAFDGRTVWVANQVSDDVTRIDAATGTVIGSPIPVGDGPRGVAFDGTNIWVTNSLSSSLTRIDAATGTVVGAPIALGNDPLGIAFDGTNMWVSLFSVDTVRRFNAATGTEVGSPITGLDGATDLAFDGSLMWVANSNSDTVSRFNAATGSIVGSQIAAGDYPFGLAFDGTDIWVACANSNNVLRLDAATGTASGSPIDLGGGGYDLAFDGSSMWATSLFSNRLLKLRAS